NVCKALKKGGVKKIISYWGAPMSSLNSGIKLFLKRLQVSFTRFKPDHFIFESYGMQKTATHGRGIAIGNASVVRLGIDASKFSENKSKSYVYSQLTIPEQRKIVFYAGHMEKRKGVDVIVKAAALLINDRAREDVHFLICGNRNNEEKVFDEYYKGTAAEDYITFGGYRDDIPDLMPGCYVAVIASTGWDSFPRSSLEMAAAGLPLLVSDLAGLNETVVQDETGLLFKTADAADLADNIASLLDAPERRESLSNKAVKRVNEEFTLDIQKQKLIQVIKQVMTE
ncbi:MAG: glycosyltransferase family 4 protein, partial [Gammaproteobacteria bacterium]|nr:glycosyltransferase family 4 protein [Gammaproteobacteria bacterium]